ncbi:unannotated protein [freshwater metagenome]|uniref:Unannotated protein n=1 Tax=freshwater metagenome TaxID=449393 RepID=A0A6J6RRS1_9ZZZZ|nr:molybdopterin-dependent oxidoreductase [Actinomycetota bacterium]MSY70500.1 molybdopterin-dependent oxidoreductase [Actinomycetota bacterium]
MSDRAIPDVAAIDHPTFCRICPVLCGLVVSTEGDSVVRVRGDQSHPVSRGYSCAKGRALGSFHHHPRRLDEPRLHGVPASWDETLDDLATQLARIVRESGPDAVAVYFGTWSWMDAFGRMQAEAIVRALGSRSRYSAVTVDAIARLTVAELVGGFGGLLPALDVDNAGLTVLIGTNPVVSHGHAGALVDPIEALRRVAERTGLWVIDPRRTETSRLATHHLAVRPGSDAALLAYVVRALLDEGADADYIARHVDGVDALRLAVAPWTRDLAEERTGLAGADIDVLVDAIRAERRVTIVTGTGTTMAASANVTEWLAWAIQIITGSFEHERGAWFNPGSFVRLDRTGVSAAPPEGRSVDGAPSRPELVSRFGERPCAVLADEIEAGNVRALLVIGGDPLTSLPDTGRLERAFSQLDVLAVADVVEADTVAMATHVLAVAGQLERDDVNWFTDRFSPVITAQRTEAVVPPGASRRSLVEVLGDVSDRLGLNARVDPAERMAKCIERIPGLAHADVVISDPPRVRGWVHDRVLPEGRWRIAPRVLVEQLEELRTRDSAPLVAIPRRAPRRMNSAMRDVARGGEDSALWCNPQDATGLVDGQRVTITARHGSLTAVLRITDDIVPGAISVPHGLSGQNVSRLTSANPDAVDPLTGMITQSGIPVTLTSATGGT